MEIFEKRARLSPSNGQCLPRQHNWTAVGRGTEPESERAKAREKGTKGSELLGQGAHSGKGRGKERAASSREGRRGSRRRRRWAPSRGSDVTSRTWEDARAVHGERGAQFRERRFGETGLLEWWDVTVVWDRFGGECGRRSRLRLKSMSVCFEGTGNRGNLVRGAVWGTGGSERIEALFHFFLSRCLKCACKERDSCILYLLHFGEQGSEFQRDPQK